MDSGENPLLEINPHSFPAKLWRLVNNPAVKAIFWDSQGEGILIDQHAFEAQTLYPGANPLPKADRFKTTNYASFLRQLNLYGFKIVYPGNRDNPIFHHFSNPDFKQNHPELLGNLKRLTADNKAKIKAGLNVSCRPPSSSHLFSTAKVDRDTNMNTGKSVQFKSPPLWDE